MLFRIEDSENLYGCHREYIISRDNLPRLRFEELEGYLADEIRKEVNNTNDRKLLSYSKSLGVCLLKYNKYTDNELHINRWYNCDFVGYYDIDTREDKCVPYNLVVGIEDIAVKLKNKELILINFAVDVSDNNLLDEYLQNVTGIGRKKVASPEKDKEVILMQSPEDIVISDYLDSVYLLYALFLKYGMNESIYTKLIHKIRDLGDYRFGFCGEQERDALLFIVDYLYYHGEYEIEMSIPVFLDSQQAEYDGIYYDSFLQLQGIQNESIEESYMLSDYNANVVSDWIWQFYAEEHM